MSTRHLIFSVNIPQAYSLICHATFNIVDDVFGMLKFLIFFLVKSDSNFKLDHPSTRYIVLFIHLS